jgi:TrmH family RNA methyltransferase
VLKITSLHNPRIKNAIRLREPRARKQQQRIIIDGRRETERAWQAGVRIDELYVCPESCGELPAEWIARIEAAGATVCEINTDVLARLAFGQRAEGFVAVAHMPQRELDELTLPACPLVAVVEGVEKPGNLGAVLRTADAAGLDAVILVDSRIELYNPNAIRASLGAIFTVPVVATSGAAALAWLRDGGLRLFAARVEAAASYTAVDFRTPCAIVLGNEATGLTDLWRGDDITAIALPMRGRVDSLNLSATAAVLFYHAMHARSG